MYKKEFDMYLQNKIPRATLLYGESEFLIQTYSKKILEKLEGEAQMFYYADYSLQAVLAILTQSSLFGDSQIVVLRLDKKLDKKELTAIFSALEKNPSATIIIEFYCAQNKNAATYIREAKTFGANFKSQDNVEVRFFEPTQKEALEFLRQEANKLHIKINNQNLEYILAMQNFDILLAKSELSKFTLIDNEVSLQDIQFLCYGLSSVGINELIDSLFAKKNTLHIFAKMLEEGIDEMSVMRDVENYFFQLFLFFAYIRINGASNPKEILDFTPPPLICQTLESRCIRIKEEEYLKIFALLGSWRNELMRGQKNISLQCLIKIQALIR